jgi:MFS family permease
MSSKETSDVESVPVIMADEAAVVSDGEGQQQWKPSTHELLIMIALSVISFMVALDACIIVTSLTVSSRTILSFLVDQSNIVHQAIVTALEGTAMQGFWVGTSYLLANAVTMPFIAAISDIFGRPICLIVALIMFTTGSILCAAAHNIGTLLVGRSVQGIGGGGIMVLSLVIFTDIVPLRFRPKWYGTV